MRTLRVAAALSVIVMSAQAWADEPLVTAVLSVTHAQPSRLAAWMTPSDAADPRSPATIQRPNGIQWLFGYDNLNAVLACGTPAGIADLRKLVAVLDQPVPRIQVEGLVIEMPQDHLTTTYGLSWRPAGNNRYATFRHGELLEALRADWQVHRIGMEPFVLRNGEPATLSWRQPEQLSVPAEWQVDSPLMVRNRADVTARVYGSPGQESITVEIVPRMANLRGLADAEPSGLFSFVENVSHVTSNVVTVRVLDGMWIAVGGLESGRETPAVERVLLLRPTVARDAPPAAGLESRREAPAVEREVIVHPAVVVRELIPAE